MTRSIQSFPRNALSTSLRRLLACAAIGLAASPLSAARIDVPGPDGSVAFGTSVTVLPNGNIVVTDPLAGGGAVYLLSPTGGVISTLTGGTAGDQIGNAGIVVLGNGNFVVMSPLWDNGAVANAGAATWVDGDTGLSGTVSADNSLVGSRTDDMVGSALSSGATGVVALTNGNYVVVSSNWSNGTENAVGAVTWANGNTGRTGAVSSANSLTGTSLEDFVGSSGVTPLPNGHYVVRSPLWMNGATIDAGAVTWADGTTGLTGQVSIANSLVGTHESDLVGSSPLAVLGSGDYVVVSPSWSSDTVFDAGAVTWANGSSGRTGEVSGSNSLVGTHVSDRVGFPGVAVLTNGNYVVRSSEWDSDSAQDVGAVTWANGTGGLVGIVDPVNSVVGTTNGDRIGDTIFVNNRTRPGVVALANGNYVIVSYAWDNGALTDAGAVTWANGATGRTGAVSTLNSIVGGAALDSVGSAGVRALSNGNYVVLSPGWKNGATSGAGAVTWAGGTAETAAQVSTGNSLVGTRTGDSIGSNGLGVLPNGHYVVLSPFWDSDTVADAGAATWLQGNASTAGTVVPANSLVGSSTGDIVGSAQVAVLANGNYVVSSPEWDNGPLANVGASTLADGDTGLFDVVSPLNSLVGSAPGDGVGNDGTNSLATIALSDGNYVVISINWDNGAIADAGAVTLARGDEGAIGTIDSGNSVLGTAAGDGDNLAAGYDVAREQLVVGRPGSNIVSLFTLGSAEVIFANGFE